MKLLVVLFVLCCTWAVVSADATAMRLKARINSQTDAPVTSAVPSSASVLSAESSAAASSSMSADAPESASEAALSAASSVPASKLDGPAENSQSCGGEPSCKPTIVTCCGNEGNQDSGINVEDAIGPINQWLKDFKKRSGSSSDLYSAAKMTVQPLIQKIKRNQQMAIEKLEQSNSAILQHIEEAATEHIYNLLKAEKIKEDNHEASEALKDSESSGYFSESSSQSSSMSQSLSSAAAEKVYSELLKAASHSENSESRSELEKIAKDIVKNGKF